MPALTGLLERGAQGKLLRSWQTPKICTFASSPPGQTCFLLFVFLILTIWLALAEPFARPTSLHSRTWIRFAAPPCPELRIGLLHRPRHCEWPWSEPQGRAAPVIWACHRVSVFRDPLKTKHGGSPFDTKKGHLQERCTRMSLKLKQCRPKIDSFMGKSVVYPR